MDAAERNDAGNASTRTHDHLAADLLAEDSVGRADIVRCLGRHGRRLDPEPVLADGERCLVNDAVARGAAVREREVETRERELEADHVSIEETQGCFEELLAGVVALENDDCARLHGAIVVAARRASIGWPFPK